MTETSTRMEWIHRIIQKVIKTETGQKQFEISCRYRRLRRFCKSGPAFTRTLTIQGLKGRAFDGDLVPVLEINLVMIFAKCYKLNDTSKYNTV